MRPGEVIGYGNHVINAGLSRSRDEDEIQPLLDEQENTDVMEEAKIGVSSQTLVSRGGNEASKLPQYVAALLVTLGGCITGTVLGWSSPANPLLEKGEYGFTISEEELAWIGSIMAIGAIVGSPLVGWMVDFFGRKNTMLILLAPCLVGWACIIWAESTFMFCIGRFIIGIAGGGYTIVVPLYINEYSQTQIRGTLGAYFQFQLNIGILFTYVVGYFVAVFWLSIACAVIPIVFGACVLFLPESPVYLLKTGYKTKARESLQWFRGEYYDVQPEINEMQKNLDEIAAEKVPMLEAFSSKAAKRGLIIGLGIMGFQQLSGINSVIFYTTQIFQSAGSSMDSGIQTIIVGTVSVVVTFVSTIVVDRLGRRPLLLLSDFFMAICTTLLGLYFFLKDGLKYDVSSISWLPVLSVCTFIVMFSLGFGPIPWMFMSEIFPRQISGYACSIACMFNWTCVFLVTRSFSTIKELMGSYGAFWIFSVISFIGTVFVFFLVPETKGKTLEEVQQELGGNKNASVESGQRKSGSY